MQDAPHVTEKVPVAETDETADVMKAPPLLYADGAKPAKMTACVFMRPCLASVVTVNDDAADTMDATEIGAATVNCVAPPTDVTIRGP